MGVLEGGQQLVTDTFLYYHGNKLTVSISILFHCFLPIRCVPHSVPHSVPRSVSRSVPRSVSRSVSRSVCISRGFDSVLLSTGKLQSTDSVLINHGGVEYYKMFRQ